VRGSKFDGEDANEEAHARKRQARSLRDRPRLHGDELQLRAPEGQDGDDRAPAGGGRSRRHLLRHRPGLRPLHERGARRGSARSGARPGGHRHEIRVRVRRRREAVRARQPARSHPPHDGCLAQTPPHGRDRPVLPAPRRSERAHGGRRGHGEGADPAGEGEALRSFRGGREEHPPRSRRSAGDRAAKRVLAVVAGAGRADPPRARGAGHRLRAFQPPGQGVLDRQDRRDDAVRRHGLPQHRAAALTREPQGQPGDRGSRCRSGGAKACHASPDRPRLGTGPEAVVRAHSGNHQALAPRRKPGRGGRSSTPQTCASSTRPRRASRSTARAIPRSRSAWWTDESAASVSSYPDAPISRASSPLPSSPSSPSSSRRRSPGGSRLP